MDSVRFLHLLLMLLNGVLIIPAKIFGVHYRFSTPLAVIGLVVISASIIFGIYKAMNHSAYGNGGCLQNN